MHFTHLNPGSGNKATKMAIVAGLHVLVGAAFIHSINTRHITMPKIAEDVLVMIQPQEPPPPPPEPPKPRTTVPPEIFRPPVPETLPPPQDPPPVQSSTIEPDPTPTDPTPTVAPEAPPAQPSDNTGAMHTAVLADPNACAKPAYPRNALMNGDTGTVTLALLVGADGKVTSSRIQQSSGHPELDRAAVKALSLCRFKPATNNGVPEAGWGQIAYAWSLDE